MAYARQRVTVVSRTHRNTNANKQAAGRITRTASKRNKNVKAKRTATRI